MFVFFGNFDFSHVIADHMTERKLLDDGGELQRVERIIAGSSYFQHRQIVFLAEVFVISRNDNVAVGSGDICNIIFLIVGKRVFDFSLVKLFAAVFANIVFGGSGNLVRVLFQVGVPVFGTGGRSEQGDENQATRNQ